MADEVVAVVHSCRDPGGVLLEVDAGGGSESRCLARARHRGDWLEPGPLENHELGLAGDPRSLLAPGCPPADDAPVDEDDPLHPATNLVLFRSESGKELLQARWYAPVRMAAPAPSSPHSLATASGLLLGTTGAAMALGALIGWLFGSAELGLLVGAIVGIPLAVFVVYMVYARTGR
jgi:hypothetical protein